MLKILCLGFAFTLSFNVSAHEELEIDSAMKISEIKELVQTLGDDQTCLDEFLKRRKRLITSLVLTPVKGAGIIAGSGYAGAGLGAASLAFVPAPGDGWSDLARVVGGLLLGSIAGSGLFIVETTKEAVQLAQQTRILKAVAEAREDRVGEKIEDLHARFLKAYPDSTLTQVEIKDQLRDLDETGRLCDGSFAKKPKIKLWEKLKHKLARQKLLFRYFNESQNAPLDQVGKKG